MKGQLEIYKMIRKPMAGPTRIERPLKGRGYKRPQNKKDLSYATEG